MQEKMIITFVCAFFSLLWLFGLFCILKPEPIVKFTAKFFKRQMNFYGFKAEVEITPKAKMMCRIFNIFMVLFISLFLFLIFSGRLR